MFHLRLIKARSYTGHGLSATKKNPDIYTEDKATADALAASGYFQLVEGNGELSSEPSPESQQPVAGHLTRAQLEDMKTEQLKQLAQDMGINVAGFRKKADYVEAIIATEVTADPESGENGNEVDYGEGSPTMAELQQQ